MPRSVAPNSEESRSLPAVVTAHLFVAFFDQVVAFGDDARSHEGNEG